MFPWSGKFISIFCLSLSTPFVPELIHSFCVDFQVEIKPKVKGALIYDLLDQSCNSVEPFCLAGPS